MLLNVRTRQEYLKTLGYYKGGIDGIEGKLTKQAYKGLQNSYFTRAKDKDGLYGKNTDTLLRSAYNCYGSQYFKLQEFKCKCGGKYCTGYPAVVNKELVNYLNDTRRAFGRETIIQSGLRCSTWNRVNGGATLSRHKNGKAVDITMNGYTNLACRKNLINHWIINYATSRYGYCNGYYRNKSKSGYTSAPNMGTSTHIDVA